jgi:hypothetical protein
MLSGSTLNNGRRGQLVLSKQLGAGTVGESSISLFVKQKTDCKMLWQMKLETRKRHQLLVQLFMHQGLQPMHFEPCDKMVHRALECHKDCYHCCHRSLLSPISVLKVVKNIMFFHLIIKLSFVFCILCSYATGFCM